MNENTNMVLRYGYAWREKVADEILARWASLPAHKRLWWTLRGKAPADRTTLIAELS